jgi:hypothetical protein
MINVVHDVWSGRVHSCLYVPAGAPRWTALLARGWHGEIGGDRWMRSSSGSVGGGVHLLFSPSVAVGRCRQCLARWAVRMAVRRAPANRLIP